MISAPHSGYSDPYRIMASYYGAVDLSEGRDKVPAKPFKNTLGAEGSTHAVNPEDNNTMYSSTFYGALARAEMNNYPAKLSRIFCLICLPGRPS